MQLKNMADYLTKELTKLPYIKITYSGGICDSISIIISKDKKETWPHGYLENSNYMRAMIFCKGQREQENDLFVIHSGHIRQIKKPSTASKITNHLLKEIKKWEAK